nr:integrase, catalytic region, zinc finger, CCHC-type, peptidase aspartic, catalytic [Tanacetum cinerariifolium]
MTDNRTMAEMIRAPTEGCVEAIVAPPILAEQFELKHSLINMMTLEQFFGLEKDNPHDHIRWGSPPLDTFYNALNPADQDSLNNATGGNLLEKSPQDALTIIENKSKVRNSRSKPISSPVNAYDINSSSEIAKLTHPRLRLLRKSVLPTEVLIRTTSVLPQVATLSQNSEITSKQGEDSDFKDSIDQTDLANLNDLFVDPAPEMFTNEHAPDYSFPPRFDVYPDDFLEIEDDDLPSPNNEDKVFNPGILIHEKSVIIITRVTQENKLAISYASLVFEDFDPPFYEPLVFKVVPNSMRLLLFSFKNEEKVFKPVIYTSDKVVQIVLWYLDSGCPMHMTRDRSQLINFVQKFLGTVKFRNDHVAKIMGYGDYKIGNVTILRVYFMEGLGLNLFSVGQFCDSDLEVAFRQHTCFIRNLDGVDLLTGSQGNNLYTLSLQDMMASW